MACRKNGRFGVACDIHHLTSGGRRMGHAYTIGLCPWHHRGVPSPADDFGSGPSLAYSKRAFNEAYGTEITLLEETNKLLERM